MYLAIKIFNKGTKKKQQRMLHKIQSLNCYSGKKYSIYFQINATDKTRDEDRGRDIMPLSRGRAAWRQINDQHSLQWPIMGDV